MGEANVIAQLAAQFGAPGLLIGYMVWDRLLRRKDDDSSRAEENQLRKERIEADKSLAASLATLTTAVQQMERK